jgi:hypothetical protein
VRLWQVSAEGEEKKSVLKKNTFRNVFLTPHIYFLSLAFALLIHNKQPMFFYLGLVFISRFLDS